MDFMNLNQAAHGDREHGFIGARMRLPRKVIAATGRTRASLEELGAWMRSALRWDFSRSLRIVRFATICATSPSPRATRSRPR